MPVLAHLAAWDAFPDRRKALCTLCAFAEGNGTHAAQVADAVRVRANDLAANWHEAPTLVQRALLLLSRFAGVDNNELRSNVLRKHYVLTVRQSPRSLAAVARAHVGRSPTTPMPGRQTCSPRPWRMR